MKYTVEVAGTTVEVEVDADRVTVAGRAQEVRLAGRGTDAVRRLVRPQASRAFVLSAGEGRGSWIVAADGERLAVTVLDARDQAVRLAGARSGAGPSSGKLKAPMPGLVLRVLAAEGDAVTAGQGLVVVEAMKMENELKAPRDGVVARVHVAPGARVEKGAALLDLR